VTVLAPRTVMHLIETGGAGGAERVLAHIASSLGPDYCSETALIRDSWLGGVLRERGIPVTMLQSRPHGDFATLRDILRLIRKKRVAILHSHEFYMNVLGLMASRLTGVPLVATVHEKNYYPDRFRRRVAYRVVGSFAGQMVAVSEDLKQFLAERIRIPLDRIRVVPNGIPCHKDPPHQRAAALRAALGLDPLSQVVGTVGRLVPKKGYKYLIDGGIQVAQRFPGVIFLVVGRGELRDELEGQARRLGIAPRFRLLGHREDVSDILSLCDIFVLPSLSEGMPLALLEAMAAGVPAVATRVGGVTEVLEDGKSGFLVPPGDSQALARGIISLLEDRSLARRIGNSAREVVASRFSLNVMVEAYRGIYAKLIRGG